MFLQQVLGDTIIVSQPTVSRIVFRVSVLLARIFNEFIKMPRTQEAKRENQRLFRDIGRRDGGIGLPGIDGAIDCTHIRLVGTRFYNIEEVYRNQKGYLSLNVQVCTKYMLLNKSYFSVVYIYKFLFNCVIVINIKYVMQYRLRFIYYKCFKAFFFFFFLY